MADDFIDRRAAGFGEVVVVERGGVAVPCCTSLNRQSMLIIETVTSKGDETQGTLSPQVAAL